MKPNTVLPDNSQDSSVADNAVERNWNRPNDAQPYPARDYGNTDSIKSGTPDGNDGTADSSGSSHTEGVDCGTGWKRNRTF